MTVQPTASLKWTSCALRWNMPKSSSSIASTKTLNSTQKIQVWCMGGYCIWTLSLNWLDDSEKRRRHFLQETIASPSILYRYLSLRPSPLSALPIGPHSEYLHLRLDFRVPQQLFNFRSRLPRSQALRRVGDRGRDSRCNGDHLLQIYQIHLVECVRGGVIVHEVISRFLVHNQRWHTFE